MKNDMMLAASKIAVGVNSSDLEVYVTTNGFQLHYSTIQSVAIKHLQGYDKNFLVVEFYKPITYLRTVSGETRSFMSVALLPKDDISPNDISMDWMLAEFDAISEWMNKCLRNEIERRKDS